MDNTETGDSGSKEVLVDQSLFEDKEITLKDGEKITLPSLKIKKMKLFHGTSIPGIEEFKDADETTVGDGLYLTSQKDAARGYAEIREEERSHERKKPIVYEVEIGDLNIVSLTSIVAIDVFARLLRQEAAIKIKEITPLVTAAVQAHKEGKQNEDLSILGRLNSLQRIRDVIDTHSYRSLKDITSSCGDLVRQSLVNLGFDGLMTIEGGESYNDTTIGDHDSYVIFDPKKAKVMNQDEV